MPKRRGTQPQQPAEIRPGESVEIALGRLESGEWYGRIGRADDENAMTTKSAFPHQVLSALGRQVRANDASTLAGHKLAGGPECGYCEHATLDGRICSVLECPIGGAPAVAQALKASGGTAEPSQFTRDREIVRLYGRLEKPRLVGEEKGEELTATLKMTGEDLSPEYTYLRDEATKEVVAIIYHAISVAKPTDVLLGQQQLDFSASSAAATVPVLSCPVCLRIVRTEGAEPGQTCPLCENGTLEIVRVPALLCCKCQAAPDLWNVAPGDECVACGKGRYEIGGQPHRREDAEKADEAEGGTEQGQPDEGEEAA